MTIVFFLCVWSVLFFVPHFSFTLSRIAGRKKIAIVIIVSFLCAVITKPFVVLGGVFNANAMPGSSTALLIFATSAMVIFLSLAYVIVKGPHRDRAAFVLVVCAGALGQIYRTIDTLALPVN